MGLNSGVSLLPLAILLLFTLAMLVKPPSLDQNAFANESIIQPPIQIINGRAASIEIKTNPTILSHSDKELGIQFRLYYLDTGMTITHTTYLISITKGYTDPNEPPLLSEIFHSHDGPLILNFEPTISLEEGVSIKGGHEQFLNAWLADENDIVSVKAPNILHAALYHIEVEIVTVDDDRNVFEPPQKFPKFDQWLNVSERVSKMIKLDDQSYNSTVVSYFDRIENFTFNEDEKAFSWSVPFDWNTTIIQNEQSFYVHQHLIIPKSLFKVGSEETNNVTAPIKLTLNGLPLNGRSLATDPYSYENEMVYHVLVNKQQMLTLAEKIPMETRERMTFEVTLNDNVIPEFGIEILAATAAIMGMVIIVSRYQKLWGFQWK